MESNHIWIWIALGVAIATAYNSKHHTKELNETSLTRMQFVEINLVNAQQKTNEIIQAQNLNCFGQGDSEGPCGIKNYIDSALVDVRTQLESLHKELDD